MKLSEATKIFIESKRGISSNATLVFYHYVCRYLIDYFNDGEIEKLTTQDLREWRSYLFTTGKAVTTVRHAVRSCKTLYNFLENEGLITVNAGRRLETPRLPDSPRKGISDEALEAMIKVTKVSKRDEAMILFLRDSGCRRGGLATLKLTDLELDVKRAMVYEKGQRGGEARYVYFTDECQKALAIWLEIRCYFARPDCEAVFCSINGQTKGCPLTVFGVNNLVNRWARTAGVQTPHSPHQFRHAAARRWIKNGAPLPIVQQLMGHKDPATTSDFYSKLDSDELAEQFVKYATIKGHKIG